MIFEVFSFGQNYFQEGFQLSNYFPKRTFPESIGITNDLGTIMELRGTNNKDLTVNPNNSGTLRAIWERLEIILLILQAKMKIPSLRKPFEPIL